MISPRRPLHWGGSLITVSLAAHLLAACSSSGSYRANYAPYRVGAAQSAPASTTVASTGGSLNESDEAVATAGFAPVADSDREDAPAPSPAPEAPSAPGGPRAASAPPAPPPPSQPRPATTPVGNRGPAGRTTPAAGTTPPATPNATPTAATPTPAPMLIYTADVRMLVEQGQMTAVLDRVTDLAYRLGGYLVRRSNTSVQVRVPSPRFRDGLGQVEGLGEVVQRSINADDVSEEFRDMEVRLQNLRAVRRRLEEFLSRAANVQEALSVERELERVAAEIDRIEGRMRFLSARVAFSLITVNVAPRPRELPLVPDERPVPPRQLLNLPVPWLDSLGIGRLLNIR